MTNRTATLKIQFPDTARDAAVLMLDQIVTAINRKEVVGAPGYINALDAWCAKAAVILSDAKVE